MEQHVMQSTPTAPSNQHLDQLLAGMAAGSSDALAEFYHCTIRAAYAYALSLLRDPYDAQDVLQDTYLRAWNMADKYRPGGKPVGWLLTILRNLAYMKLRSGKRTAPMAPEDLDAFFAAQPAVSSEDRLLLKAALLRLKDEERQVVLLHAGAGLLHREIAEITGMPLGTVLAKYRRALKKMKTAWEED